MWAEDTEGVKVVGRHSASRRVGSGVTRGCMHVSTGAPLDASSAEEHGSSEEQEEGIRDSVLRALEQRLARAGKKGTNDKKESSKAARVRVDKSMTPSPGRWQRGSRGGILWTLRTFLLQNRMKEGRGSTTTPR